MSDKVIAIGFSGATGAQYGLRLVDALVKAEVTVHLVISTAARVVLETEVDVYLPDQLTETEGLLRARMGATGDRLRLFAEKDWFAPMASGSNAPSAMVICPCSMSTLSAIACGASNNLMQRAADVMLKERRPLILVPREMPFSTIHLENMLRVSRAGAVIMPPSPGFYQRPASVDDMVDFVVARILDHLEVKHQLSSRWSG